MATGRKETGNLIPRKLCLAYPVSLERVFEMVDNVPIMFRVIKVIGSLAFAISLLVGLVVILTVSTLMESVYGTPFAQKVFYNSLWFDIFLSLVWINIFFSTLSRYPFKKHHTGFVITHIGILLFLIGSLISRALGIEGQMTLFEKEMRDRILTQGYELRVRGEKTPGTGFLIHSRTSPSHSRPLNVPLKIKNQNVKIQLVKTIEHAKEKMVVTEGSENDPINRAAEVRLASDRVGLSETVWLIEKDPVNPHASFTSLGPAQIELKTSDPSKPLKNPVLHFERDGKTWDVEVKPDTPKNVALGELKLSDIRYIPSAKVLGNGLVNAPDEIRFNPAVEFKVSDGKQTEEHTKFFLFPSYGSLRGGQKNNFFDLTVDFDVPSPEEGSSPALTLYASRDGEWSYTVSSSKGKTAPAPLESDKETPTGWMDMRFKVVNRFMRAKIDRIVAQAKPNQASADFAAQIKVTYPGGNIEMPWLFPDQPISIKTADETLFVSLKPREHKIPFSLHLLDFRKVDYPGTANPSSFESDVILYDEKEGITIERTIKMNKPLDYKGWRVFQASYMQDEEVGEASVFSIAKNPGIYLIYGGAVTILIGVITLFYLHPFFNGGRREK